MTFGLRWRRRLNAADGWIHPSLPLLLLSSLPIFHEYPCSQAARTLIFLPREGHLPTLLLLSHRVKAFFFLEPQAEKEAPNEARNSRWAVTFRRRRRRPREYTGRV